MRAPRGDRPNRGAVAQNHNLSNRGHTNALSGHARQNGPERIERVGNIQRSAATLLHPRPIGAQLRTHKHAQQDSRKNQAVIQATVACQKRLRQTAARQTPHAASKRAKGRDPPSAEPPRAAAARRDRSSAVWALSVHTRLACAAPPATYACASIALLAIWQGKRCNACRFSMELSPPRDKLTIWSIS